CSSDLRVSLPVALAHGVGIQRTQFLARAPAPSQLLPSRSSFRQRTFPRRESANPALAQPPCALPQLQLLSPQRANPAGLFELPCTETDTAVLPRRSASVPPRARS